MTIEEIRAAEAAALMERRSAIAAEVDAEGVDLDALDEEVRAINAELEVRTKKTEIRAAVAAGAGTVTKDKEDTEMSEIHYTVDSPEYRTAWLKMLQHRADADFTVEERAAISSADNSAGYAIPTETLNKILESTRNAAPALALCDIMHIPSNIVIPVENDLADAAIHSENADITGANDSIARITLGGYEMVKLLQISAKVEAMTIPAFEQWIVSNLSRSMSKLLDNYIINGNGSSQPKGIAYAETWVDGANAVDWASTAPTVAEIQTLIGLQKGKFIDNAKFLMSWKTFWTKIHPLRDEKKPEILSGDKANGYYIFGFPVIFDSLVADSTVYFGDFYEGVKGNFAKEITVESSRVSGFRQNATDYRADCIFDCTTVAGRFLKFAATL